LNFWRRFSLPGAVLALLLAHGPARADETAAQKAYADIVTTVIQPGYEALSRAARRHEADWAGLCKAGSADNTRESFQALADSWAEVEVIHFGPSSENFVRERISFWPERKNAVARALAAALETPASVTMDAAWIKDQSAAIQGLPALERLLYGNDGTATAAPAVGSPECRLGLAIAGNLTRITGDLARNWKAFDVNPAPDRLTALATDIVSGIGFIKDEKLEPVFGRSEELSKPKAAEFWRSQRSLRSIVINLETYRLIARIFADSQSDPLAMPKAVDTAIATAAEMQEPLAAYARGQERRQAFLLLSTIDSLGIVTGQETSAVLGVTVGFNSSDGD
jgi:predicted lipoprotein